MNDLEKLKNVFIDLGIDFSLYINDGFDTLDTKDGFIIKIKDGFGYGGFYTVFHFNKDGSFSNYGCFE